MGASQRGVTTNDPETAPYSVRINQGNMGISLFSSWARVQANIRSPISLSATLTLATSQLIEVARTSSDVYTQTEISLPRGKIAVVQLVKSAEPWSDPIKMRGLSNVMVVVGGGGGKGGKIREMRDGMNWGCCPAPAG